MVTTHNLWLFKSGHGSHMQVFEYFNFGTILMRLICIDKCGASVSIWYVSDTDTTLILKSPYFIGWRRYIGIEHFYSSLKYFSKITKRTWCPVSPFLENIRRGSKGNNLLKENSMFHQLSSIHDFLILMWNLCMGKVFLV